MPTPGYTIVVRHGGADSDLAQFVGSALETAYQLPARIEVIYDYPTDHYRPQRLWQRYYSSEDNPPPVVFLVTLTDLVNDHSTLMFDLGLWVSKALDLFVLMIPPVQIQNLPVIVQDLRVCSLKDEEQAQDFLLQVLSSLTHGRDELYFGERSSDRMIRISQTAKRLSGMKISDSYIGRFAKEGKRRQFPELADSTFGIPSDGCQYPVWFGTNRDPSTDDKIIYGAKRSEHGVIYYGKCDVYIPRTHKIGSTGSNWWQRLLTGADDRLKIRNHTRFNEEEFWKSTTGHLAALTEIERTALVFVHGYNVSFGSAMIRAAQIGADLKVPLTAVFSWPSSASLKGYAADVAAIEASEQKICDFLTRFLERSGAERVHLLAHSMGNRGVLRSFQEFARRAAATAKVPFGQIFLAAPDVDTDLFLQIASAYKDMSLRTSLYVSSNDRALASSGIIHGAPRAGYAPPITIVSGIDTIEVSAIDLSRLGHGFFAAARAVLTDMHALMVNNDPPSRRMGLVEWQNGENIYWRIRA